MKKNSKEKNPKSIISTYKSKRKNKQDMSIEFINPDNVIKNLTNLADVNEKNEESIDTEENLNL